MHYHLIPSFVILFLIIYSLSSPTVNAESEAEALMKWKSSLLQPQALSSWSITADTTSPCKWYGITCNLNDSVVQLSLPSCNLTGTLDSFNFSSFSNLNVLNIGGNNLYGSLPESISFLSKLTLLDLNTNSFNSSIPLQFGHLQELLHLSFCNNNLSGVIPYQLTNLQKLQHLDLGYNFLRNPSNCFMFRGMPSLTYMSLSLNSFTEIPSFIFNFTNLTVD